MQSTKTSTVLDRLLGVEGYREAVHFVNEKHALLILQTGSATMSDPNASSEVKTVLWIDDEGRSYGLTMRVCIAEK